MNPLALKPLVLEPKQIFDPDLKNLKISDFLTGTLWNLEGRQNLTNAKRALFFLYDHNEQTWEKNK